MNKATTMRFRTICAGTAVAIALLAGSFGVSACAKGGGHPGGGHFAQNHPRRAQVLHRDNGLKQQIRDDRGHLGGHYGQLQHEQSGIRHQEQRDAHVDGGHITPQERKQLNHEESGLQHQMNRDYSNAAPRGSFANQHPRRSQVLRDDRNMGNQLNQDKGHLGGNYGKLEKEDQGIRQQEQADAKANGGFIKPGQERKLFSEENNFQNQIRKDNK